MKKGIPDIQEALLRLNHIFIQYPRFARLLDEVRRVHIEADHAIEPLCMMITGESGVGKSTLIAEYVKSWPRIETDEGVAIPVLTAEVPLPATISGLASQLLRSLGAPSPERGTVEYKRGRLIDTLRRCGVRLVILDEFQHLVERGTKNRIETVADWIKSLINESRIPFVLVGVPTAKAVLQHSSQLARRFPIRREITPFDWIRRPEEFTKLLQLLDEQLPFTRRSGLATPLVASRFFIASKGKFGYLALLLRDAGRSALRIGSARLELSQLAHSYDSLLAEEMALRANPFAISEREVESWVETIRGTA